MARPVGQRSSHARSRPFFEALARRDASHRLPPIPLEAPRARPCRAGRQSSNRARMLIHRRRAGNASAPWSRPANLTRRFPQPQRSARIRNGSVAFPLVGNATPARRIAASSPCSEAFARRNGQQVELRLDRTLNWRNWRKIAGATNPFGPRRPRGPRRHSARTRRSLAVALAPMAPMMLRRDRRSADGPGRPSTPSRPELSPS